MERITPADIIAYKLTGKGNGTGYIYYVDDWTHNTCIDVYRDGKLESRYQTNDDEMLEEILEKVENV